MVTRKNKPPPSTATKPTQPEQVVQLAQRVQALEDALKGLLEQGKQGKSKKADRSPLIRTPSVAQHPGIEVRDSGVHGKGVFATTDLPKNTTLVEYVGEILTWKKAQKRHPHNPDDPNHTFFFHVDDKVVIDAAVGGNDARWINHACRPNCEPDDVDGRIFIKTIKKVRAGEELFYDYGLIIEDKLTKKLKAEYACRCGATSCRGTMLALPD
jgi:uncharacterized protein